MTEETRPQTPREAANETPKPAPAKPMPKVTDDDIKEAGTMLDAAFSLSGNIHEGRAVCPACGTSTKGKIALKTASGTGRRYWKCYKCGERGDAISLVQEAFNEEFIPAVNRLLGRVTTGNPVKITPLIIAPAFVATVDSEVYNYIAKSADLAKAVEYYGTWHITEKPIISGGGRYILDATKLQQDLLERFGRDRLLDCGVMTMGDDKVDYFLFNDNYPVIEPHINDQSDVVGMQFRPSFERRLKVQAHKIWKKRWSGQIDPETGANLEPKEAWAKASQLDPEAAGPMVKYIPPFLSLKGAGADSLIGCGIHRIAKLPPNQLIYVVEGFKDMLAARTMGVEAYAIPGTGVMPAEGMVCDILKRHRILVTLDADEAGAKGRENVLAYLLEKGIRAKAKDDLPNGFDITDILVQRWAHTGCACVTCVAWRVSDPGGASCNCPSCRKRR